MTRHGPRRTIRTCLAALICAFLSAASATATPPDGGFLNGGLLGEYFANPNLSGTPSFTRRDIRLNFDWGRAAPGGNPLERALSAVPADNFSVRWTGLLASRSGGERILYIDTDDGARLFMRTPGSASWTTVIDAWNRPGSHEGRFSFPAGSPIEIRVEYRELTGNALLRLRWSEPGAVPSVIENAFPIAMNHTAIEQTFVDAVKTARSTWEEVDGRRPPVDGNGWPMGDAAFIVSEYLAPFDPSPLEIGLNRLSFEGTADLSVFGNYEIVPGSVRHDRSTGTTHADLIVRRTGSNVQMVTLRNARRRDGTPGFTNLRIMRPVQPGARETFSPDQLFHPALLDAYQRLSAIRFQRVNDQTRTWEERIRPGFFASSGKELPYVYRDRYGYDLKGRTGMSHEFEILLCNTTGKDYFVTVPHLATVKGRDAYIRRLARLIRYGSDGVEPYTSPQENPVFPPLNPNLHVYIEVGNELWNFAQLATYAPFFDFLQLVKDKADANDEDFRILNFDNLPLDRNERGEYVNLYTWVRRYWALYLKQISDVFREEFGDEAMPGSPNPRIRPFFTWQYANTNETAIVGLDFMDRYFANADGGNHVAVPRPVSYYFYGGGGAGYYSVTNRDGTVAGAVPNSGFEEGPVGRNAPGWEFRGTAGVTAAGTSGAGISAPPAAMEGRQFAYLQGGGGVSSSASVRVRIPAGGTSRTHALLYRWVGMSSSIPRITVSVNGRDLTPRGPNEQPRAFSPEVLWRRVNYWTGDSYFSETFEADPGSEVTISFTTDAAGPQGFVFLDDVRLTSINAFYTGGLGSGAAMGQTNNPYIDNMIGDANWALAYGLRMLSYEHGYSAGGDAGNSPLQDHAKFIADEARKSMVEAFRIFQEAGGDMPTLGTYSTWPLGEYLGGILTEGTLNSAQWPLVRGIDETLSRLPELPRNGSELPALLGPSHITLGHRNRGLILDRPGSWVSFNLVTRVRGEHRIDIRTEGSGTARIILNGRDLTPAAAQRALFNPGIHSLRVLAPQGGVKIRSIAIAPPGAPQERPNLTLRGGDGIAEASWTAVPQATSYRLALGTRFGGPYEIVRIVRGLEARIEGLENGVTYHGVVHAVDAEGRIGLPSEGSTATPAATGAPAVLAGWSFRGLTGGEAEVAPLQSVVGVRVSPLRRGPGLRAKNELDGWGNSMISEAVDHNYEAGAEAALAAGDFLSFDLAPAPGGRISVESISFRAFQQNASDNETARGTALAYRTEDGRTGLLRPIEGRATAHSTLVRYALAGMQDLQNLTGPVNLRLIFFGNGPYEFVGIGRLTDSDELDVIVNGSVGAPR